MSVFEADAQRKAFCKTITYARLSKYLVLAEQDEARAVELYCLNAEISRSLYIPVQIWEISLRNRINDFLCWKFGRSWPFDEVRALRNLAGQDRRRVQEAKARQVQARSQSMVGTNHIVADLSAGFWVSLLAKSYDVQLAWRHNLARVFPVPAGLERQTAHDLCTRVLDLRNRIAHHEPVIHLPVERVREDISRLVTAMCPASAVYLQSVCHPSAAVSPFPPA